MKISAIITLKKNVLDPQGKVIQQSANSIGYKDVVEVKQGKFFEIVIKNNSDPRKFAQKIAEDILANEVIEDYEIIDIRKIWIVQL